MSEIKAPLWRMIELERIQLMEVRGYTEWKSESLPAQPPEIEIKVSSKASHHGDARVIEVFVKFDVLETVAPEEPKRKPCLHIAARYRVVYRYPDGYNPDRRDIDDFAARNVPFNLWPFWRELVNCEASRMGIPLAPLPLFRVRPPVPIKRPATRKRAPGKE